MNSGRDVPETLQPIMVCWKLVSPNHQPLRCELGRSADGLQLSCVRDDTGNAVRVERVESIARALELAAVWKDAYAKGSASVAEPPPRPVHVRTAPDRPLTILERRAQKRVPGDLRRMPD